MLVMELLGLDLGAVFVQPVSIVQWVVLFVCCVWVERLAMQVVRLVCLVRHPLSLKVQLQFVQLALLDPIRLLDN